MSAHATPPSGAGSAAPVTLPVLARMTAEGRKIAMLTAYDATLAAAADAAYATGAGALKVGAAMLVVGCVPRDLGAALMQSARLPVIGIGAGTACSGQELVIFDALGVTSGRPARFVRNFMPGHDSIEAALAACVAAVKDGSFPAPEHCF